MHDFSYKHMLITLDLGLFDYKANDLMGFVP